MGYREVNGKPPGCPWTARVGTLLFAPSLKHLYPVRYERLMRWELKPIRWELKPITCSEVAHAVALANTKIRIFKSGFVICMVGD